MSEAGRHEARWEVTGEDSSRMGKQVKKQEGRNQKKWDKTRRDDKDIEEAGRRKETY